MLSRTRDFIFALLLALSLPACQSAGLPAGAGSPTDSAPTSTPDSVVEAPRPSTVAVGTCEAPVAGANGGCVGAPFNDFRACNTSPGPIHCIDGGCGYEDIVGELRASQACGEATSGKHAMVQLGFCGEYPILDVQDWGLGSEGIEFFDPKTRQPTGIQAHSDTTQFCNGSSSVFNMGTIPDCQPVICETLCQAQGFSCGH